LICDILRSVHDLGSELAIHDYRIGPKVMYGYCLIIRSSPVFT